MARAGLFFLRAQFFKGAIERGVKGGGIGFADDCFNLLVCTLPARAGFVEGLAAFRGEAQPPGAPVAGVGWGVTKFRWVSGRSGSVWSGR